MADWLGLHCRAYNALLEEKRRIYGADGRSFGFGEMCKTLTSWRREVPALTGLNAQSLQVTAKRVDLAFKAFFRRGNAGETPGYPRFKPAQRFAGWGYKTHGDDWKILQPDGKHGRVRLTGIGHVRMRGQGRFTGTPKTAEIVNDGGKWYLSVTYIVNAEVLKRKAGSGDAAFDWGLKKLLTIATDNGIETVDNPRWLKKRLAALAALQRTISAEHLVLKGKIGLDRDEPIPKGTRLPVTPKLKRLYAQVRSLHSKISRQRHDFYHKITAELVSRFGEIATEELDVASMTKRPRKKPAADGTFEKNESGRKAKLNRSILDAAPATLIAMLTYKAEEAGTPLAIGDTRKIKPTQRCCCCGAIVEKTLSERTHRCSCGIVCGRDENAARTLLRWLKEKDFWSGTGQGKSQNPAA